MNKLGRPVDTKWHQKVLSLIKANPDKSYIEIAEMLGYGRSYAHGVSQIALKHSIKRGRGRGKGEHTGWLQRMSPERRAAWIEKQKARPRCAAGHFIRAAA